MIRFPNAFFLTTAGALAVAVAATPILAQRGGSAGRPSRQCMQEVIQLCGMNRSEIPACLQSKADQLSDKCRDEFAKRIQQRMDASPGASAGPGGYAAAKPTRTVIYGNDPRQQIDVFAPAGAADSLPLVLFVHGGGWRMGNHKATIQNKPAHFNESQYFFASTGYRLLPEAPVEEQAKDVGAALQALVGQAESIGFDPSRVVLMGHSAGAHLAALVASDPQYAGEAFGSIKGVVLLDGAGYDVPAQMAGTPTLSGDTEGTQARYIYEEAFGTDPARQRALSPITHVGGPDAPHWLALYVAQRAASKSQSDALVAALASAGAAAQAAAITGTDHGRMNRELGTEAGAAQTQAVDAFLAEVFGG